MHHLTELCSAYTYRKDHISSYPWVMRDETDLKRVHIIGLGDVGLNAALGLRIAGAGRVSKIGIYDIDRRLSSFSALQKVYPRSGRRHTVM